MNQFNRTYLFIQNNPYIEELYEKYINDPNDVDISWHELFAEIKATEENKLTFTKKASWTKVRSKIIDAKEAQDNKLHPESVVNSKSIDDLLITKAYRIIQSYRDKGHFFSDLDPLNLENKISKQKITIGLNLNDINLTPQDLEKEIILDGKFLGIKNTKINDLIKLLEKIYCGNIGFEISHVQNADQKNWLENNIEKSYSSDLDSNYRKKIYKNIVEIENFEEFLHTKFPGTKRFSIEGGATSICSLETIIEESAELGVETIIIGMAHRGRLNVLTKVMGKEYCSMLSEFQGNLAHPEELDIPGDVKYHLGFSSDRNISGKNIHLSLVPNPSHLEAVNPVAAGKIRALQDIISDNKREKVMGILIHGDAAFSGQGVVVESLCLSDLEGYNTGGIIHIVINNQIGFTTNPKNSRTSRYATEFAKTTSIPIIHVNGDDPDSVAKISKIASEFRKIFKKDIVIDIVCYRLYGHNEGDEPYFTQPIMYNNIKNHKKTAQIYQDLLLSENILNIKDVEEVKNNFRTLLEKELQKSTDYKPRNNQWLEGYWSSMKDSRTVPEEKSTGVSIEKLKKLGIALSRPDTKVNINPKIVRQLESKSKMIDSGENIDWAMGEALAFASLLIENIPVRLSGQDAGRGTFSHRHSVLIDQNNEEKYIVLNNLAKEQAKYEVVDSNLSEYAVLGFEYGYSIAHPNSLVIWEAQFGDFSNGAQIIIDQYISSAEMKWLKMSGLVMLLPHGYEGQGPEHSSARLERYLQLCAQDNIIVANCTTPASLFHILRRQLIRQYRKPLIIMSPKSLLRHKLAVSKIQDMDESTKFSPIIAETSELIESSKIKKLILCSGKIYYELFEARAKLNINNISIIRIEQLYPLPKEDILKQIDDYNNADIYWVQEEPKNMGAWIYIKNQFEELTTRKINYVGRENSASPASGYKKIHDKEQADIINYVLGD